MAEANRTMTDEAISVVPANEASWDDLQTVLGARGDPSRCQCQWFKIRDFEWRSVAVEERAERLRAQTDCGRPGARTTSGLVAYLDGEPVGWCAVEPRTAYVRLLRTRVPWTGRAEDKADDGVWAVTCFVTRTGFRRRGVSGALARATVDFARERGARAPSQDKRSPGASCTSAAEASSPPPGSPRSAGRPSGGS
jgi:GNAT superfamily N-acetyltransferase